MSMASYWDLADQAASILMSENSSALNLESADAVGVVTAIFAFAVQIITMYGTRRTTIRGELPFAFYDSRTNMQIDKRSISGMLSSTPYLLGVSLYFMLIGPLSGSFGQFLERLFDLGGLACVVSLFSSMMCLGSCIARVRPSGSVVRRVLLGLIFGLVAAFVGATAIALNNNELVPWFVFIAYIGIYWLFGHFGRHHVLEMKTPPETETSAGSWGGASLVLLVTCGVIVACHVALVPLVNLPAIQIICNEASNNEAGTTEIRRYNPLLLAVEQTRYDTNGNEIISFNNQFDFTRKMVSYQGYWPDGSQASNAKIDYEIEEMLEDVKSNSSITAYKLSDDGSGTVVVECERVIDTDTESYQIKEYSPSNPDILLKRSYYDEDLEPDYYYVFNYEEGEGAATGGTAYNGDESFRFAFSFDYYPSGVLKTEIHRNKDGEVIYTYSYDEDGNLITS